MRAMSTAVTSTTSSDLRPAAELVGWAGPELTEMASLRAACREYQARAAYRVTAHGSPTPTAGRAVTSLAQGAGHGNAELDRFDTSVRTQIFLWRLPWIY